jgi:hypothetical protein
MSKDQRPKDREELLQRLMYYFQPDVLAVFHSRPDKYRLETDDFSGHVEISNTFQDPLNGTKDASRLSVDFGLRKNQEAARRQAGVFDFVSDARRRGKTAHPPGLRLSGVLPAELFQTGHL